MEVVINIFHIYGMSITLIIYCNFEETFQLMEIYGIQKWNGMNYLIYNAFRICVDSAIFFVNNSFGHTALSYVKYGNRRVRLCFIIYELKHVQKYTLTTSIATDV